MPISDGLRGKPLPHGCKPINLYADNGTLLQLRQLREHCVESGRVSARSIVSLYDEGVVRMRCVYLLSGEENCSLPKRAIVRLISACELEKKQIHHPLCRLCTVKP